MRILSTPTAVYAALSTAMRLAGTVPADTMALNRYLAAGETDWSPGGCGLEPGTMTTVRDYLVAKLALPADLPEVA